MPTPNYSFVLSAQLLGSTTISVGKVMITDPTDATKYVVATSANRGTRRSEGIALTAWSDDTHNGSVQMQQSGTLDATISGLSSGYSGRALVRCSSAGTMERIAVASVDPSTDDIIGYAEEDGRVHLYFGFPFEEVIAVIEAAIGQPAAPNKSLQYDNNGAFGAVPMTYEGSGEIRAAKGTHQTVTNEAGTGQVCVWSRFQFPADAVYPTSDVLSIGALDDSDPGWDDSKPGGIDFYAKTWFLFQTGIASDTDWAGLLGFQAIPASTMTGTGWMAYPNFIVSGTFGPEYVDKTKRFGDGTGVLCLEGAAVNPSAATTGGIAVYSDASDSYYLKYKLPSGTTAVPVNTLTNVGAGSSLVKTKSGINYDVRTIVAGSGITVTQNADDVTIASSVSSGAPTDATYVTLSTNGTLTNERVLTAGTNISITDGGAGSTVTIACTGTFLTVAGSSGEIQTNSGSGTLAAATNIKAGSNYVSLNSSATTGYLRMGSTGNVTQMTWRPSVTDITVLATDSSGPALQFGDPTNANATVAGATVRLYSSTRNVVQASTTKIQTSSPLAGDQSNSVPFRLLTTTISISGADGATTTATSAQYECPILILSEGGGGGTSRDLVLPDYAGATYIVTNGSSGSVNCKKSGGTGVTIGSSVSKLIYHDGSDYRVAHNGL